ncbi:MAG: ABC transporter permease subunit [Firmicutes bacterium]|nr:ABC transporter permease subunit [Bacillota bacterium]
MQKKTLKKIIFFTLSIITIISLWWIFSSVQSLRTSRVIPSPWQTIIRISQEIQEGMLFSSIFRTLLKVLTAVLISFILGFLIALLASFNQNIRHFITPFVTIIRAVPTIGVILVLIVIFRSSFLIAVIIASIMIFPMLYENFYTAFKEVDKNILQMARVHKIPKLKQVLGVYVPSMLPHIFSGLIQSVGMGLKVVIAAEIMAIPFRGTLGSNMFGASQYPDFELLFAYIVVAIAVSFLIEGGLRLLAKLTMPWKKR